MLYKTIVLELLERSRETAEEEVRKPITLAVLELYATELKRSHEAFKEVLSRKRPGSDESQIASEALDMAAKELAERLSTGSPPNEDERLTLDGAMAYIRRHTPPA